MPSASTRRAARATRAQSAQRHTLRCGIGGLAARSAQQRKADHVAQFVVGRERAPLLQLCCELTVTASGCASTSSTPVGRMEVRVAVTSRLCCTAAGRERDGELVQLPLATRLCWSRNRMRSPPQSRWRRLSPVKTKLPSACVVRLISCPSARKQDLRFGNYRPTAVFHDAAQFLRRCSPHAELHHQECQSHDRGNLATADLRHPCIFAHRPQLLNYRISDE